MRIQLEITCANCVYRGAQYAYCDHALYPRETGTLVRVEGEPPSKCPLRTFEVKQPALRASRQDVIDIHKLAEEGLRIFPADEPGE